MRIDELQGIKRQLSAIDFSDLSEFTTWMKTKGFLSFKPGTYAVAFSHERLPYIIKVSLRDDAYGAFLSYVRGNRDDIHLPRVFKTFEPTPEIRVTALERLSHVEVPNFKDYIKALDLRKFLSDDSLIVVNAEEFRKDHPSLAASIVWIYEAKPSWCVSDLGSENIMQRPNGTLVITDPWA